MKQKTSSNILSFLIGSQQQGQGKTTVSVASYPQQPVTRQQRQTAVTTAARPAVPVLIKQPVYSELQNMQLVSMLAGLLENGVRQFEVVEQCGRVFVIRYEMFSTPDPVLPFVFRDYGRSYRRSYRQLTTRIANSRFWGWDYKAARRLANTLLKCVAADKELTAVELTYYQTRLMYAIAMPQKHR